MKKFALLFCILFVLPMAYAELVSINPANPYTNDSLACSINLSGTGYDYNWYVNDDFVASSQILDS
ncbi:hypothetical protein KY317_00445, partial [Candidatus Woesearchaeota archaeon]|nr:hypothetical protein [Candidatus Woesearchaeota archaeon]